MRKYLLAAVAAAAVVATPAFAQSGPYAGIEGGVLFPQDSNVDAQVDFIDPTLPNVDYNDVLDLDYKRGYDIDAIVGYDFGAFRVEGELGYKRAKTDKVEFDEEFIDDYFDATGEDLEGIDTDVDGRISVKSLMLNGLADFDAGGARLYAGAGIGRAKLKLLGDSDSAWAYQLIAGAAVPIANNVEAGLKYRYFRTGKVNFSDNGDFTDADVLFQSNSKFQSHSLLASLIFNFGAPTVAAPMVAAPVVEAPAPVAPATQTCANGTVILATDMCPMPPAPPMAPQAGERG
ncbi:porin family protein [Sphingomonas sinipercae]|uniref:Porin family protein n=1 Tax=Sphingomonas sinipercae TaxID=2714944 RepID=A0A6G7ZPS4_9SPHN|nr:outer membrane beta-barrel protein [Sphingomonas sinipercae]QIL02984.1 porin family protein [Sphingomonas sinipercae]